jgi:hypothetical protein
MPPLHIRQITSPGIIFFEAQFLHTQILQRVHVRLRVKIFIFFKQLGHADNIAAVLTLRPKEEGLDVALVLALELPAVILFVLAGVIRASSRYSS